LSGEGYTCWSTWDALEALDLSGEGYTFWSTWDALEALDLSPLRKLERDLHFGRSSFWILCNGGGITEQRR
jgi:hypothetical protein